jgi:hypothetical protein
VKVPKDGLLIYNTNDALPGGKGFYYWSSGTQNWLQVINNNNIDSIKMQTVTRDTLLGWLSSEQFRDTIVQSVASNGKLLRSVQGTLIVTGGDSSVLRDVMLDVNIPLVVTDTAVSKVLNSEITRDTLKLIFTQTDIKDSVAYYIARDSVFQLSLKEMLNGDSIISGIYEKMKTMADSVGSEGFIQLVDRDGIKVSRADSSVFKYFRIGVNGAAFRDSVHNVVMDSVLNGALRDTVISLTAGVVKDSINKGAVFHNIRIVDATKGPVVIEDTDYTVLIENLNANGNVILPDPVTCKGRILNLGQLNAQFEVNTSQPLHYSETYISSKLEAVLTSSWSASIKLTIQSDGVKWYVISTII